MAHDAASREVMEDNPPLPPGPPPGPPPPGPPSTEAASSRKSTQRGKNKPANRKRAEIERNPRHQQEKKNEKRNEKKNVNKSASKDGDDGWQHYFDQVTERFFFYNKFTKVRQWINPRVPLDDPCNRNLPTFQPPDLPDPEEAQDEYTKALNRLKEDPEFTKLSTFEKYKRVESLKRELEGNNTDDVVYENKSIEEVEPFSEIANFHDTKSQSQFAKDLNSAIRQVNSIEAQQTKPKHRVTKKQVKEYNNKKRQQKQKRLMQWLKN